MVRNLSLPLVAVAALLLPPALMPEAAPTAQAQRYFTTVTERDSSTLVWVNVGYPRANLWKGPYRVGDLSGFLIPTSTRIQWYNSQGHYEYATIPAGTRYIRVQRAGGRALHFHCYR